MKMLRFVALLAVAVAAPAQLVVTAESVKGPLSITITDVEPHLLGYVYLTGELTNGTPVDLEYVSLLMTPIGSDGSKVDACLSAEDCTIKVFGPIPPGVTSKITGGSIRLGRQIPKGVGLKGFVAEVAELLYTPSYVITAEPATVESVAVTAAANSKEGVVIQIQNLTASVVDVVWDESSFVDLDGESSRLVRSDVRFVDKDRPQPNSVIPPYSKLTDTLYPSSNIAMGESGWIQIPILPSHLHGDPADTARLAALPGRSFHVFLRLRVGDERVDHLTTFTVQEVLQ